MALDPSIILQGQAPQFQNPLDVASKAMTMQNLAMQNKMQSQAMADDQSMRSAFSKNMTPGADGQPTIDRAAVLSDLAKTAPMKAVEQKRIWTQQDAADQEQKLKTINDQVQIGKTLLNQVRADPSIPENIKQSDWDGMLAQRAKFGLSNDHLPPQYPGDAGFKTLQAQGLSMEEKLAQHNKDREFNQKSTELALKREELHANKDTKDAEALDKHLALGWTARSGQAGVVQGKITQAEAAQALIDQTLSQKGGADSRQLEEVATSVQKLLGGGAAASARVEALLPHTMMGKAMSLQEYLSNSPTGQNQQEFVKRLADTVAREKIVAERQKTQFQIEGLPAHAGLKQRNPDLYQSILKAKGIDPSMIDQNGRYKAPASPFHTMSDDDLDKAYKAAGGQ